MNIQFQLLGIENILCHIQGLVHHIGHSRNGDLRSQADVEDNIVILFQFFALSRIGADDLTHRNFVVIFFFCDNIQL